MLELELHRVQIFGDFINKEFRYIVHLSSNLSVVGGQSIIVYMHISPLPLWWSESSMNSVWKIMKKICMLPTTLQRQRAQETKNFSKRIESRWFRNMRRKRKVNKLHKHRRSGFATCSTKIDWLKSLQHGDIKIFMESVKSVLAVIFGVCGWKNYIFAYKNSWSCCLLCSASIFLFWGSEKANNLTFI